MIKFENCTLTRKAANLNYLSVKWSFRSPENLKDLYEKLKGRFLASQRTDALQI